LRIQGLGASSLTAVFVATFGVTLCIAGVPLRAQTASDSARADSIRLARQDSAGRTRAVALAPVKVTALGAALAPTRVPYAISQRQVSEAARLVTPLSLEEPLRGIAGVQLDNRNNIALGERLTIRGFGARTQFGVRGVRVEVDDVPATMPDGQTALTHVDPAAVGSVEVLRGPASALFGNAAGGFVRIRSQPPPDSPFALRADVAAAERGTVTRRVTASTMRGRWSADARLSDLRYEGYRQNSDATDLRGGGRIAREGTRDTVAIVVAAVDYDAKNPGGLTDSARTADPRSASATNLRYQTGERGTHEQAGASWRHGGERSSIVATAFLLGRHVDNPIPQRIIDLGRRAGGARVVVERALAPFGREGSVSLGIEHSRLRDDRRSYNSLDGVRGALALDQREEVFNTGAFARLAMPVLADLHLLAAVRDDDIRFTVSDRLITPTDPDDGGKRIMRAVSPSAGLSYAFSERANVYANVATAFETPTTTELANQPSGAGGLNPTLSPQRVTSWELGTRVPLGAIGSASLSVYDARVRDALVPFELASSPGRQFFRNASRVRHRGLEGEGAIAIGSRTFARTALSFIDARFVRDEFGAVSRAGKRVPGVAPGRLDVDLRTLAPCGTSVELALRAQSRAPASDLGTAWSPGYAVVDLRGFGGRYTLAGVGISPGVALSNVLDARYDASLIANAARDRFFEPGPGRTVTVAVAIDWLSPAR
jgi:iron complex outermembrane receptor protein